MKKKAKDQSIPASCRRMLRVMLGMHYVVSHTKDDQAVGALALRRSKGANPLIYLKLSEPFAGVIFLRAGTAHHTR